MRNIFISLLNYFHIGGYDFGEGKIHKTTELVSLFSVLPGPTLPVPLWKHAMVSINTNSDTMIIGGTSNTATFSAKTWIYK